MTDSRHSDHPSKVRSKKRPIEVRERDSAASGAPAAGWATGDRFSWEEIHQRLLAGADEEVAERTRVLFFSGLTAGFAITLTFLGLTTGLAAFPDNPLLASLLYPIGFLYIVLGRYQLFTENTLPPVKLVLTRLASLPLLLRLWAIVLVSNILGAMVGAFILSEAGVVSEAGGDAAATLLEDSLATGWWSVFFKAFFAGWLVAGLVWLSFAARDTISRVLIIYFVFFTIHATGLYHIVSSACEVFFVYFRSGTDLGAAAWGFLLPVGLGNTIGGVVAFSVVGYVQSEQQRYPEVRVLSLRDILFSCKGGRPFGTPRPRTRYDEQSTGEVDEDIPQEH
ncbi:formate/nitrite transporter family protein [Sulfitobacter sp. 915]|uniref:formate/nitrite transporter family protein n=1 Tax=Sulfitobacter sp. 915 TaxID=3368558 RepID=UPI0037463373